MITDAMLEADPYLHISDMIDRPEEYLHLTDAILHDIAKSTHPVRSGSVCAHLVHADADSSLPRTENSR